MIPGFCSRVVFKIAAASSLCACSCFASERVRIMAANTTSGNFQSYDPGEGIRIFQGLDPDVILIQEFNYGNNSSLDLREFVDEAFGEDFECYREAGNEQIPNGIISRFPIIASGEWEDVEVSNRDFAWARIDIPGDKDLWAVSVHFLTRNATVRNAEATALVNFIQNNVPDSDYLVVGGDFNTDSFSESALSALSSVVETDGRPDDQNGTTGTNASRSKPYDQVLPDSELEALETSVTISGHSFTYAEGLVFDSRVFTPLSSVSPVQFGDSGASNMQHMAVIRDFLIPTDGEIEPAEYPTNFSGNPTDSSIQLTWVDSSGSPTPVGYLIRANTGGRFATPMDGDVPANDADLSDGSAEVAVGAGVQSYTFSGLLPETSYAFQIHPYTVPGSPDYKTDGTAPQLSVDTLATPVDLTDPPALGLVYYLHSAGFTVTWTEVEAATGYRLDVSESPTFSAEEGGTPINENFDASSDVPTGWVNSGSENWSNSSHYASAPNCRAMGPGDTVETPSVDNPTELEFSVDSSGGGNGKTGTVSYSIDGGAWTFLSSFTVSTSGTVETVDLTGSPNLSAETNVRFRFESTFFTWYLDDVTVSAAAGPGFVGGYEDKVIPVGRYHAVEGLQPDTTYYFRMRSVNEAGASANTPTGSVTTELSGTPFSVWASDNAIGSVSSVSNFDGDLSLDFEEYVYATDPGDASDFGAGIQAISIAQGLRFSHRQSKAPNLDWDYLGTDQLLLAPTLLTEGTGPGKFEIVTVQDYGSYEVVTVDIYTGGSDNYFVTLRITQQ